MKGRRAWTSPLVHALCGTALLTAWHQAARVIAKKGLCLSAPTLCWLSWERQEKQHNQVGGDKHFITCDHGVGITYGSVLGGELAIASTLSSGSLYLSVNQVETSLSFLVVVLPSSWNRLHHPKALWQEVWGGRLSVLLEDMPQFWGIRPTPAVCEGASVSSPRWRHCCKNQTGRRILLKYF